MANVSDILVQVMGSIPQSYHWRKRKLCQAKDWCRSFDSLSVLTKENKNVLLGFKKEYGRMKNNES